MQYLPRCEIRLTPESDPANLTDKTESPFVNLVDQDSYVIQAKKETTYQFPMIGTNI